MALASTLPIYRVTYELLQVVTRITKDMPRDYKQSLGNRQTSVEVSLYDFSRILKKQTVLTKEIVELIENPELF